MSIWRRILAGAARFTPGGPLGTLVGKASDDRPGAGDPDGSTDRGDPTRSVAFTIAVVALGAKLAKADGMVTEDEVDVLRQVFQVPPDQERNLTRFLNIARRHAGGFEPYAQQVAGMFRDNPVVLEELLNCLFYIAKADGVVADAELTYLREVARLFGLSACAWDAIRAAQLGTGDADPYCVLGLEPDADIAEIKAAYRRLVREHHPDQVIAQGMPEEFVQVATDRLAAINTAYERVGIERGFIQPLQPA